MEDLQNPRLLSREYFKQGKVEQFKQILEEGSSPEIDGYYADVRYEGIAILNALGAYYSYLGKIETKHRGKEDYFIQATKYYNKASNIDMHEPSTWIGKGYPEYTNAFLRPLTDWRCAKSGLVALDSSYYGRAQEHYSFIQRAVCNFKPHSSQHYSFIQRAVCNFKPHSSHCCSLFTSQEMIVPVVYLGQNAFQLAAEAFRMF
ncbi:hypothetical protein OROHE_022376 [Orobanche hederae]